MDILKLNLVVEFFRRAVKRDSRGYVEGRDTHPATIEGGWSFVKRAWYGQHRHHSTRYTPLYLVEACEKYNYRSENISEKFLTEAVDV